MKNTPRGKVKIVRGWDPEDGPKPYSEAWWERLDARKAEEETGTTLCRKRCPYRPVCPTKLVPDEVCMGFLWEDMAEEE